MAYHFRNLIFEGVAGRRNVDLPAFRPPLGDRFPGGFSPSAGAPTMKWAIAKDVSEQGRTLVF